MRQRPAAVAGVFYPRDPAELLATLRACTPAPGPVVTTPKAIIAPHAGYEYSGPVAGSAYALVAAGRGTITRVVLFGPSHRVAFNGVAVPSATSFTTPLGDVPVDTTAVRQLLALPQVTVLDEAHAREHSLEVHLPFLQVALGAFTLVPLVAGDASPEDAGAVLQQVWGGRETLVVVSSDLSHYLAYPVARRRDAETAAAIVALRDGAIHETDACGAVPVRGLLWVARHKALGGRVLDLRNSGDTAGPRDQVVGYGAFAFDEMPEATARNNPGAQSSP